MNAFEHIPEQLEAQWALFTFDSGTLCSQS
jgi:hypothetical protein